MKNPVTTKLSNSQVNPIIKFCAKHRGAMARIHEEFQRQAKAPVDLTNIQRWLAKDPEARTEPTFGSGLLLVAVAKKVMDKIKAEKG